MLARALLLLSWFVAAPAWAGELEPWSVSEKAPVVREGKAAQQKAKALRVPSSTSRPVLWLMRFYSGVISPADGARCNMYPTCAGYAASAVRKHGPIIGGFLMADRFIHEGSANEDWYTIVRPHGRARWRDPVEENDFWFAHK